MAADFVGYGPLRGVWIRPGRRFDRLRRGEGATGARIFSLEPRWRMSWWPPLLPFLVILIFLASGTLTAHAATGAIVGTVTKVQNQAQVGTGTAIVGTPVHMNDELRTGPKARLEVTFRDQTTFTLGENAKVVVDRFVFNPETSTGELVLNTGVAAFRLATGKISEMRNKNINVSTPVAALAVRGTNFWWGPLDGTFGVLLMSNSKVDVSNEAGAVMLTKVGEGTDIDPVKGGGAPGRPYQWPPERVAEALATTEFGLALGPGVTTGLAAAAAAAAVAITVTTTSSSKPASP